MGKRELLIVSLFVAAGAIVYQLTAPRAEPRSAGLLWPAFLDAIRLRSGRPTATASKTMRGALDISEAITEARVSGIGRVSVIGADRADIAYELTVETSAATPTEATEDAAETTLWQDRVGSVLALRLNQPRRARSTARLVLTVPSRLALRTDGGPGTGRLEARNIASLRLESVVGDVHLAGIAEVTGSHRNGELTATGVGAVQLSLVASQALFDDLRGAVVISARNGRLQIRGSRGTTELDLTNQHTTIEQPAGDVHVLGTGGTLVVGAPEARVTIDVRRMAVDLTLARSVPVAVLTADAPLRLGLIGVPDITVDASVSDGGRIRVVDFPGVRPPSDELPRLVQTFGAGTRTIALRNQRADIVIAAVK